MKNKRETIVFHMLIKNPEYWIWFTYILIASLSFVVGLIDKRGREFASGPLYFISMSIIAPLFIDFIINRVEIKKYQQEDHFLTRKTLTLGACVLILILCFIFLKTKLVSNVYLQLVLFVSAIVLSLYMFCLNKLPLRYDEYSGLDDVPYHLQINEEAKKLLEQNINYEIKNSEGKEIKL